MSKQKNKIYIFLTIFLLVIVPWVNSNSENIQSIPKISQESNPFFEINPCKISLFQFITSNYESIYQDHFYFRPDNKSSIGCFGTITGVTVLQKNFETQFFISVGTNSLISILLQGSVWLLILLLIPKNKKNYLDDNFFSLKNFIILLISYLYVFSIYAQKRFYEDSFFYFDLDKTSSYLFLFLIVVYLVKNIIEIYLVRSDVVVNYLPYIYLITTIFSGFNFNLLLLIFIYISLDGIFKRKFKINKIFFQFYIFLSMWWLINSNGSFYFKPGKLRSFTNSVYEFNSNLYWIIFFFLFITGIYIFVINNKENFNFIKFTNSFSISSFLILALGLFASNFPILNFMSYYFLGLQRNVVELTNPFAFDEFFVKISWRGIYPSAETIGEFYALSLLLILFKLFKSIELNKFDYVGIFSSSLGLYFSDNRTSIVIVFLAILFYFYKTYFSNFFRSKFVLTAFGFISVITVVLVIGFNNLNVSYEFMSKAMFTKANLFQFDTIYSSYLDYIIESYNDNTFPSKFFSFLSVLAYVLNRSEIWGLFFTRYNPTYMELIFGSGPLTFGQLYGEIVVSDSAMFLLPHSSLLSFTLFFGLIPTLFFLMYIIYKLINNRNNTIFVIFNLFVLINIFKNDSLNYFSVFVMYLCLYIFLKNDKNTSTVLHSGSSENKNWN